MIVATLLGDSIRFIFEASESRAGTVEVGGPGELGQLAANHFLVSGTAIAAAVAVALPIALWLGHIGRGQFLAGSVANVGRAVPALALLAFFVAFTGVGFDNVLLALILLAIPPIFTNTYVAIRQVDREVVDAARGQGMTGGQIVRRVELPLAVPTIFSGVRLASVAVVATAIIAPLAGYQTLGTPILAFNVYGAAGQLGAAIVVAVLTLAADAALALMQRLVTPKGLRDAHRAARPRRLWPLPRRVQVP